MRLRGEQLEAHLARELKPVYVLSGDEPLLIDEAAAALRRAARARGYGERQVSQVEAGFHWPTWLASFDSLSLFASRRLVELHIPSGKPGVEGAKALEAWSAQPPPDTLLVVFLPRADKTMQKARWFAALEQAGVLVQVWAPEPGRLPAWIGERLARHGLDAAPDALSWIAARVEGNLLAAHQELEKLALLLPPGPVSLNAARDAVRDVARYDAGDLADALLTGDPLRYGRIADSLAAEGEAPPLAIWLVAQELRTLYRLAQGLRQGESAPAVLARLKVWESRKTILLQAAKRYPFERVARAMRGIARADRAAKGLVQEDPWAILKALGLDLMGAFPFPVNFALEPVYGH